MMRVALQIMLKKWLQISISDSKFILGILERGLKPTSSLKTAFGQDEQNITILIPVFKKKNSIISQDFQELVSLRK